MEYPRDLFLDNRNKKLINKPNFKSRKGEDNGNAKITKEMAKKIKTMLLTTKMSVISKQLKVSYHIVENIKRGSWGDL